MAYDLKHRTTKTVAKGMHFPLGATVAPDGVNFAVYSKNATEVFLLLFDKPDGYLNDIQFSNRDKFIWHALVKGLKAGQLYGYKVRGEYRPEWGFRFNEAKLMLDLVIYEVHVKGFTAHPSSAVGSPGTYLGFIEKIPHLTQLGVNAVELLPVHEYYVDDFLVQKGLTNYWGYNSIGFFAPESSYGSRRAPGCQVAEFKTLVRELHRAGIKVILDVVYNHTGEGNEMGPMMCFRGVDNLAYYSLTGPADAPLRYYMNYTGCGNSLNFDSPAVIRLVMDSLRYWFETMHVDGFRFDLASVLGRTGDGYFQALGVLLRRGLAGSVLNRAILIAEPWDIGTYQVGNFPGGLVRMEWQVPGHDAAVLQERPWPVGRGRVASHRIGGSLRRGWTLRLQ